MFPHLCRHSVATPHWPLALLLLLSLPVRADDDFKIAGVKPRAANLSAAAISDDGRLVFTGEDDGLLTLSIVKTGGVVKKFNGHWPRGVFATALLRDGKRVVSCGDDNKVIVWDLDAGTSVREMSTGDSIPYVMSCTPDGSLAATGCNDGGIIVWNLDDGRRVTTLRRSSPLCSVLFSPDAKVLAAGYTDGQVVLWDTARWSEKLTLSSPDGASVGALAFSADSRLLATGNQNGAGFIRSVADGAQVSSFAGYAHPKTPPSPPVAPVFPGSTITPDDSGSIVFLCLSPDGGVILSSAQDGTPKFWETKTGRLLGTADWFADTRFYVARYGFTFATAAVTPRRDCIVTFDFNADDYPEYSLAQAWRLSFKPTSGSE